jgi:hypothetical protein
MAWYYWLILILVILYYFGKKKDGKIERRYKHRFQTPIDENKAVAIANLISTLRKNENKIHQTVLSYSDEIPKIEKLYLGYFDNWQSSDFSNIEKVETHFIEFTTHFKLQNTFKKNETKIIFFRGEMFIESKNELYDFPKIEINDLDELKNLKKTTYSTKDIEIHRSIRNVSDYGNFYSMPIHDEINRLESKLSLRNYFYALELAYVKFIKVNYDIHKSIFSELNLLLDQLKHEYSEIKIEENRIRDDLYNILLNILKLIDDGHSLLENMNSSFEVPIYKNIKNNCLEAAPGQFRDEFGGEFIDGIWYEKRSRKYYYTYYTFKMNAMDKERLYGAHENNLLKIEELIFSYISTFMIIMKDFTSSSKMNKYLIFRLDIEKKGVLLNHFETTLLSKIDQINFSLIELESILKKNNVEIIKSLNEINQNISNMNSGLSIVSAKLSELNSTTNQLTSLQKWNNLFTIANLHYTIKTSNYLVRH